MRRRRRRRRRSIQTLQLCPTLSTLPLRFNDNVILAGQLCPALFLALLPLFFHFFFSLFFLSFLYYSGFCFIFEKFSHGTQVSQVSVVSVTQHPEWGLIDEFTAFLYLCFFSFILWQICLILAPSLLSPPTVYSSLLHFPVTNLTSPSF